MIRTTNRRVHVHKALRKIRREKCEQLVKSKVEINDCPSFSHLLVPISDLLKV